MDNVKQELFNTEPKLQYSDVAVIYGIYSTIHDITPVLEQVGIPYTEEHSEQDTVWVGRVSDTPSVEWACVIVVVVVDYYSNIKHLLPYLYTAISRARVYCKIIVEYTDNLNLFCVSLCIIAANSLF